MFPLCGGQERLVLHRSAERATCDLDQRSPETQQEKDSSMQL